MTARRRASSQLIRAGGQLTRAGGQLTRASSQLNNQVGPDPLLVYHGLRFSLANPGSREELADARALARLQAGDVTG